LTGHAMSTSGDYRRYRGGNGRHISDTLDALTGSPVNHGLASETVLHPSALMADGLSSLLLILGPERGWNYAQEHKIPAFFVIRADKRFIIRSNASFDRLAVRSSQ
ncbi:putative Thiamine biosynthesis lipoprotein, partial [Pseudomonas syringae pv. spinaceae]